VFILLLISLLIYFSCAPKSKGIDIKNDGTTNSIQYTPNASDHSKDTLTIAGTKTDYTITNPSANT
jgi:hypothetical protein